jgi:hypothetical protein
MRHAPSPLSYCRNPSNALYSGLCTSSPFLSTIVHDMAVVSVMPNTPPLPIPESVHRLQYQYHFAYLLAYSKDSTSVVIQTLPVLLSPSLPESVFRPPNRIQHTPHGTSYSCALMVTSSSPHLYRPPLSATKAVQGVLGVSFFWGLF